VFKERQAFGLGVFLCLSHASNHKKRAAKKATHKGSVTVLGVRPEAAIVINDAEAASSKFNVT